ncbi:MAG: putative toxin-antitoxin system toxin component, PIN family [Spirochaetaceae bacterium]|nr:putative toxin-antitoxin system toxin component, PIN family [Spirochaetaceae bacterium]
MLDTNVLISALVFGGKTKLLLENLILSDHEIFVSDYVCSEFEEKLKMKWSDKADKLISIFHKMNFHFCQSTEQVLGEVRDKKDVPVLSDAIFNNVDILLTGDKDFLESDITNPMIYSPAMMYEFFGM